MKQTRKREMEKRPGQLLPMGRSARQRSIVVPQEMCCKCDPTVSLNNGFTQNAPTSDANYRHLPHEDGR
eukprot:331980-Rhodomonas_salina.1